MYSRRTPYLASLVLALAILGQWALYAHHYQHDLHAGGGDCQICLHAQVDADYPHPVAGGVVSLPALAVDSPPPSPIWTSSIVRAFRARGPPPQIL